VIDPEFFHSWGRAVHELDGKFSSSMDVSVVDAMQFYHQLIQ
jgi:hypothetical protein